MALPCRRSRLHRRVVKDAAECEGSEIPGALHERDAGLDDLHSLGSDLENVEKACASVHGDESRLAHLEHRLDARVVFRSTHGEDRSAHRS